MAALSTLTLEPAAAESTGRATVSGPACVLLWIGSAGSVPAGALALGNGWLGLDVPASKSVGYLYLGPSGGTGSPGPRPIWMLAPALLWLFDGTLLQVGWLGIGQIPEGDGCAYPLDLPPPR
jgi:hypothetical protein